MAEIGRLGDSTIAAIRYLLGMTSGLVIRPACDDDGEFVASQASSLLEFASPAWSDPDAMAPGFRRALARAVTDPEPRATVLIAQAPDGTRLGFISLKVRPDAAGAERAHVADLAVAEDSRRLGVGRTLMEAGEAWAREQGFDVLSLDVWATNKRAQSFYIGMGYRAESTCLIKSLDRA
jgi:ribosomal protein S18 acetylase RimI-like enzyme